MFGFCAVCSLVSTRPGFRQQGFLIGIRPLVYGMYDEAVHPLTRVVPTTITYQLYLSVAHLHRTSLWLGIDR